MNEETNQFKIDINAEKDMVSILPSSETPNTVDLVVPMKDNPLPIQSPIGLNLNANESQLEAQKKEIGSVGFEIKMQPEMAYKKAEMLEEKILQLQTGMMDVVKQMNNSWIPNKNFDNFEERPTVEPTNLIFEARRDRMSQFPAWH